MYVRYRRTSLAVLREELMNWMNNGKVFFFFFFFFDVFLGLKLKTELQALLEDVIVTKVSCNAGKTQLRVYIKQPLDP